VAKSLQLRVLSSSTLSKNSVININPLGYEFSLRGVKDGVTYFGCKKRGRSNQVKGAVVNDFVIPIQDKNLSE